MKLYILYTGDYYEYGEPIAVFDEEHAVEGKQYAKWLGGSLTDGFELNQFKCGPPPSGKCFSLALKKDGRIIYCLEQCFVIDPNTFLPMSQNYNVKIEGKRWSLIVNFYANNREDAIAKANELRIQILAGAKPEKGGF